MKFAFNIAQWFALAPGLETLKAWEDWADTNKVDWSLPVPKSSRIPMMIARRMSTPSRLAVEVGLALLGESQDIMPDCALFVSRHGELERSHKILQDLNMNRDISPTDFAMSVHNTAAGLLTMTANLPIPLTSISAGVDGFSQALIEAQSMFHSGAKRILFIDFDGLVPNTYGAQITVNGLEYAAGFILTPGSGFTYSEDETDEALLDNTDHLPQSLRFIKNILNQNKVFSISGRKFCWKCCNAGGLNG